MQDKRANRRISSGRMQGKKPVGLSAGINHPGCFVKICARPSSRFVFPLTFRSENFVPPQKNWRKAFAAKNIDVTKSKRSAPFRHNESHKKLSRCGKKMREIWPQRLRWKRGRLQKGRRRASRHGLLSKEFRIFVRVRNSIFVPRFFLLRKSRVCEKLSIFAFRTIMERHTAHGLMTVGLQNFAKFRCWLQIRRPNPKRKATTTGSKDKGIVCGKLCTESAFKARPKEENQGKQNIYFKTTLQPDRLA